MLRLKPYILESILVKMEGEKDPLLFELLNIAYKENGEMVTPLKMALDFGNKKSVEILLKYMSRSQCTNAWQIAPLYP
jgi:hypothetical protein